MSDIKLWMRAQRAIMEFGIDLHILGISEDTARRSSVKQIIYEETGPGVAPNHHPINLNEKAAQQLMDDLWLCGVRPKKELYGNPDKEDMKYHLEDMRRIVFNGITINLDNKPKE